MDSADNVEQITDPLQSSGMEEISVPTIEDSLHKRRPTFSESHWALPTGWKPHGKTTLNLSKIVSKHNVKLQVLAGCVRFVVSMSAFSSPVNTGWSNQHAHGQPSSFGSTELNWFVTVVMSRKWAFSTSTIAPQSMWLLQRSQKQLMHAPTWWLHSHVLGTVKLSVLQPGQQFA